MAGGVGDSVHQFTCLPLPGTTSATQGRPASSTPVPPLGSEAAAAGLCAGQCILKVNGNNVTSDGAPEVLEHFQAFRSRREEALGLYQWVYHTHEDAQEAQGVPGEDPNGDGAREDDQPNSGNGTGGQHDRDAGGDQDLFCVPSSPSFSTPSALH